MYKRLKNAYAYYVTHGPRATWHQTVRRVFEIWYEWHIGIKTAGYVHASRLGIDNPCSRDYHGTEYRTLFKVMKKLSGRTETEVLLDFGSGMGRVVIVAALHHFKRVVGIELSPALNEIARSNLARTKKRLRCRDVELIAGDALELPFPPDATVVFLFNPFVGQMLLDVFEKIRASVARRPRRLLIVYMPPTGTVATALDAADWVERAWVLPDVYGRLTIAYRTHAARE